MITKHLNNLRSLQFVLRMNSGHGHAPKPYDWRDDPQVNTSYEQDIRNLGVEKDPRNYSFPHQAQPNVFHFSAPDNYNHKDLSQNLMRARHVDFFKNDLSSPQTDWMPDVAHEKDYESEDLDFQPESFKSQHFRKKGPIFQWVIVGFLPILMYANEFIYQGWADQDYYRYQRPPSTCYPDKSETPDIEDYQCFNSQAYNNYYNAGVVKRPYFKFEEGRKVYYKFAGVNQPAVHPETNLTT